MTDRQMREGYTAVMDRMVVAGWLLSHRYTNRKGFHLTWTEVGTQRAVLLKRMIESFGLKDDDRAPLAFDKVAHGESLPSYGRPFEMDAAVAEVWRQCVAELGIVRDEDTLLFLVHTVSGWAPDERTPVKFGIW